MGWNSGVDTDRKRAAERIEQAGQTRWGGEWARTLRQKFAPVDRKMRMASMHN